MHFSRHIPLALILSLCLVAGNALAQPASTATATPTAKKALVNKLLQLQQPGIEALARNLVEQPAGQMLQEAGGVLQTRVPPDKREALGKAISADAKRYVDEALPLVRDRAIALAPTTAGKVLEDKLSEDELKQVIAILESPVYAKYMQLSGDLQQALLGPLVADTRPTIAPKIQALEASIGKRLNAAAAAAGKPAAPASTAKPAR